MKPTEPLAWRRRVAVARTSSQSTVLQVAIDQLANPNSKLVRALRGAVSQAARPDPIRTTWTRRCEPEIAVYAKGSAFVSLASESIEPSRSASLRVPLAPAPGTSACPETGGRCTSRSQGGESS